MSDKNDQAPSWMPPAGIPPEYMMQWMQMQQQMHMPQPGIPWPYAQHFMPMMAHQGFVPPSTPTQQPKPDETLKVVKPKEVSSVTSKTQAGIQSPKPNSPGFLLGSQREKGYAFSPYASRTGTPAGPMVMGQSGSSHKTHKSKAPSTQTSGAEESTGMDLSISRSEASSESRSEKGQTDPRKVPIPVGIAVARQRGQSTEPHPESDKTAPSAAGSSEAPQTVSSSSRAAPTTSQSNMAQAGQWPHSIPPAHVPFMANPYNHFTITQPGMPYIMGPWQPQAATVGQFFAPSLTARQTASVLNEQLTIKTSQANQLFAGTSPNKPTSNSPKSPLDKAREKLHEIKMKEGVRSSSDKSTSSSSSDRDIPVSVQKFNEENKSPPKQAKRTAQTTGRVPDKPSKAAEVGSGNIPSKKGGKRVRSPEPVNQPKPVQEKPTLKETLEKIEPEPSATTSVKASVIKARRAAPREDGERKSSRIRSSPSPAAVQVNKEEKATPLPEPELVKRCEITSETVTESACEEEEPRVPSPALVEPPPKRRRRTSSSKPATIPPETKPKPARRQSNKKVPKSISVDVNPENKPFLWQEDAHEHIITKYDCTPYDICMDYDLIALKKTLNDRLKRVNRMIKAHAQGMLIADNQDLSESEAEEADPKLKRSKSKDLTKPNIRSDSHPSIKIKAAAQAKSRAVRRASANKASTSSMNSPEVPVTKTNRLSCRRFTKSELLTIDCLMLISIDGLFYECRIKPIEPPDIYGIMIDGERHSKARIFTEEDLLKTTFSNVPPRELSDVEVGTRLCCYWSDMIGCLYPGTITQIYPAKNANSKHLLDIEFDDGDSGKFPLIQTRLLPPNYPHVKYDSSSCVVAMGRRRRNFSLPEVSPIMISPPANRGRVGTQYQHSPDSTSSRKSSSATSSRQTVSTTSIPVSKSNDSTFEASTEDDEETEEETVLKTAGKRKGMSTVLWRWNGEATKKPAKGRGFREFYNSIIRNGEVIKVGDCAVFQSTVSSKLPYIGEILAMWQGVGGKMTVSVKWFYHPQEVKVKLNLPKHKGALFESEHNDDNDIQTIRHKCTVLSYDDYIALKQHLQPSKPNTQTTVFYLAGKYDAGRSKIQCLYV